MCGVECVAVIMAAGSGSRFGLGCSKGLVRHHGKSLLEHALAALKAAWKFKRILAAIPEADREDFENLRSQNNLDITFFKGGSTRQESAHNALYELEAEPPDTLVALHDVARCFMPSERIRAVIECASCHSAATLAVNIADTVFVESESGNYGDVLDRTKLYGVQTPQVFKLELLRLAHKQCSRQIVASDDASLVAAFHPVKIVEGSSLGNKITWRDDLARFPI